MERIEIDGQLGLLVGLLDDLFGGRARIHLLHGATHALMPVGGGEIPITAPGPLHRVLETDEIVVEHVGAAAPPDWSTSYRAWIPRGECRLVACRIEGGGDVVGVLSVLRSENTPVPLHEDQMMAAALALRFGRTAAVAMARAAEAVAPVGVAEIDIRDPQEDAVESSDFVSDPSAHEASAELIERVQPAVSMAARIVDATGLDPELVAVDLAEDVSIGAAAAQTMLELVEVMFAVALRDNCPASGLRVEVAPSAENTVLSIHPLRLSEGWPRRPHVPDEVVDLASSLDAVAQVVADPELGWVVELRAAAGPLVEPPDVDPAVEAGRVEELAHEDDEDDHVIDLMATSLADTSHMVMLALSADRRVVFCNDELAGRLGLSVADLLGRQLGAARGPSASWNDFEKLFGRVDEAGLAQKTLAWPHPEQGDQRIRWTVSRSENPEVGAVYLCFGVDVGAHEEHLSVT